MSETVEEARQKELSYIATVLEICSKANASDLREELRDLRAWLANRRTCFPTAAQRFSEVPK